MIYLFVNMYVYIHCFVLLSLNCTLFYYFSIISIHTLIIHPPIIHPSINHLGLIALPCSAGGVLTLVGAWLVLFDQSLDLVGPEAGEQLLVEPRVPLLLVEELGEDVLRHEGLGSAARTKNQSQIPKPSC